MHVLLISLFYYPEPVTKPHDFAAALVKRGHRVTAITGFPNYPHGRIYDGYQARIRQWQIIDGVRVLRVPHRVDRSRSAVRRVLSYTTFSLAASALAELLVERPDVIWTYQIGLPGAALGILKRTPLVHEVQDLWPDWGQTAGVGLNSWLYTILNEQEKLIYRHARVVTTISHGFKRALIEKGVPASKIEIIPNWANEKSFCPVLRDELLAEREGLAKRFNVIYGGNVGIAQALDVVIDAAKLISDLPEVQFVIVGEGVERQRLVQRASDNGLVNVRFLGGRTPDQMANYLALADVLLIHLMHNPAYEITIPSKTYSYLASGKPILAAAAGNVADLVQGIGAGVVCRPADPPALAQAVRELYTMPLAAREAMGEAGRQAFLANYTQAALVTRYEALLAGVVAKNKRSE